MLDIVPEHVDRVVDTIGEGAADLAERGPHAIGGLAWHDRDDKGFPRREQRLGDLAARRLVARRRAERHEDCADIRVRGEDRHDLGRRAGHVRGQPAAETVWRNRVMKNHFNSSVYVAGHLYGFDDSTLKCIEPQSAAERWKQRGFGKGSLLVADGHLWVLSDDGELALVEVAPGAYREKARARVLQGKTWTMPTLE